MTTYKKKYKGIEFQQIEPDDFVIKRSGTNENSLRNYKLLKYCLQEIKKNVQFRFYLDFDSKFIVISPLIIFDNIEITLDDNSFSSKLSGISITDADLIKNLIMVYLRSLGFYECYALPRYMTMHIVYIDDILEFLLNGINTMVSLGNVFYTQSFKKQVGLKKLNFDAFAKSPLTELCSPKKSMLKNHRFFNRNLCYF